MLVLLGCDSYCYANSLPSLLDVDTVVTEGFVVRVFFGAATNNGIIVYYLGFVIAIVSVC